MTTSTKEIYEKAAEKHKLDPDLVESVGNTVFQHLRECLNDPESIVYELPKVGIFKIKFGKFEEYFKYLLNNMEAHTQEHFDRKKKMKDQIDQFRDLKKKKRELRYEPDNAEQSCQDNS